MNRENFIAIMVMLNELMRELNISGRGMETVLQIYDGDIFEAINGLLELAEAKKWVKENDNVGKGIAAH